MAYAADAHRIYLARETTGGIPEQISRADFACDDTIYAVAELSGLPKGKHELVATWTDPHGRTRERTPLPFLARLPQERIWVWLRLHRPAGSAAISFFDPAAGMSEFVGQWTVNVALDGTKLETLRFKVLC